jgi:hypothetical protein
MNEPSQGREWLVIEASTNKVVFATMKPPGYIPRDAAESVLGRELGGVVWFTSEESAAMRAHPEWRNDRP